MSESIQRLREMKDDLPPFPRTLKQSKGFKEFETLAGELMGWDLLNQSEVSASRSFGSKDTIFPEHVHEQREWLIVFKGSMVLNVEGREPQRLLPGMFAVVEPKTVHSASFPEDCWFLAITVPRSPDWPE